MSIFITKKQLLRRITSLEEAARQKAAEEQQ